MPMAEPIQPDARVIENLRQLLAQARREDLGGGDVTSLVLPAGENVRGRFVAREEVIACGVAMLEVMAAEADGRVAPADAIVLMSAVPEATLSADSQAGVVSRSAVTVWPARLNVAQRRPSVRGPAALVEMPDSDHREV